MLCAYKLKLNPVTYIVVLILCNIDSYRQWGMCWGELRVWMLIQDRSRKQERIGRLDFMWQLKRRIYERHNQRFAFGRLIWYSCTWWIGERRHWNQEVQLKGCLKNNLHCMYLLGKNSQIYLLTVLEAGILRLSYLHGLGYGENTLPSLWPPLYAITRQRERAYSLVALFMRVLMPS